MSSINEPTSGENPVPTGHGWRLRPAGLLRWVTALVVLVFLMPDTSRSQEVDAEILVILADMLEQQHQFRPDRLEAMGLDGLSAVMDFLLPETAEPRKVDLPEETIEELVKQLGAVNYRVRETAFERLYGLGRGIEPVLVEAAGNADAEIAWRARQILRKWEAERNADKSRYLPAFAVYTFSIRDDVRLRELVRRTLAALENGWSDGRKQQILTHCISAVAQSGKDEHVDRFRPLLQHERIEVAVMVVNAVGSRASGSHYPSLLLDALQADRPEVVRQAIRFTSYCQDKSRRPEVQRLLVALFEGENEQLKFETCAPLMNAFDYDPARDYLLDQAKTGDRSRQFQVLSQLRASSTTNRTVDEKLLAGLKPLLADSDNSVRRMACRTLSSYTGEDVVKALIPLLADSYSTIPREVDRYLKSYPEKETVRRLLNDAAEKHSESKVRQAAEKLLKELGSP